MKKHIAVIALSISAVGLSATGALADTSPATPPPPLSTTPSPPAPISAPSPTDVLVATASMNVSCSGLSASAVQYAVTNGICAPDAKGVLTPQNKVGGNCGSSWLYMSNAGGGHARFHYGFHSTQGTVFYRNITVTWANWRFGVVGNIPDETYMWNATYDTTVTRYTKAGFVTGVLYGDVILWWGGICTLLDPTSSTTVTW